MTTIEVHGLELFGHHGVLEEERRYWRKYLFDIELEVRRGEIVCLLGGNASGKSTTMKTIIGTLPVAGGAIELAGRRVERWSPARRVEAGLAIVPEARRVFPEMSVGENLEMGAFTRRDAAGRDADLGVDASVIIVGKP